MKITQKQMDRVIMRYDVNNPMSKSAVAAQAIRTAFLMNEDMPEGVFSKLYQDATGELV